LRASQTPEQSIPSSGLNGFGRLASSTTNMGGVTRTLSYAYDRNGARTRITHPDGTWFDTGHDGLSRPASIADPASVRFLVAYTPHGGPSFVLRNNATLAIYGYGPLQRLGYIAMGHDSPGYVEDVFILMDRNPRTDLGATAFRSAGVRAIDLFFRPEPVRPAGLEQHEHRRRHARFALCLQPQRRISTLSRNNDAYAWTGA